jgi:hypothetical protein
MRSRFVACVAFCAAATAVFAHEPEPVPDEVKMMKADFEQKLDPGIGKKYICKQPYVFVENDLGDKSDRWAIKLTLDPANVPKTPSEPRDTCDEYRAELSEIKEKQLPRAQDIWYSFKFKLPNEMKGKIGTKRLVIAQLKQRDGAVCGRSAVSSLWPEGPNPIIAFRVIEDVDNDVAALQLNVSSAYVEKIPIGIAMRKRSEFFDKWHKVMLNTRVVPRDEGEFIGNTPVEEAGFVQGYFDGAKVKNIPYGQMENEDTGKIQIHPFEPFGYRTFYGCNYFKFGLYTDEIPEPWTILIDRFRRGGKRTDVE